jgi:hypothetical protein
MKLRFTLLAAIGVSLSLLITNPSVAADNKPAEKKERAKENERDPKKTVKANSSRNNNAVKIYPDPLKRVMHVVAKDNDGKEIDFFVFDLQGTLMQHYKMSEGDREKLTGLNRGKYVYHVFSGDEETATGEFEIR